MIRASIIGPWHFGHGSLAAAIGGISAVCLASAIAFHPGSDGSAKLSVTGSRRAAGGDGISMLFEFPVWLVNIAHIPELNRSGDAPASLAAARARR